MRWMKTYIYLSNLVWYVLHRRATKRYIGAWKLYIWWVIVQKNGRITVVRKSPKPKEELNLTPQLFQPTATVATSYGVSSLLVEYTENERRWSLCSGAILYYCWYTYAKYMFTYLQLSIARQLLNMFLVF